MMSTPLEQFYINILFNDQVFEFVVTNNVVILMLIIALFSSLTAIIFSYSLFIPSVYMGLVTYIYSVVLGMFSQINSSAALQYYPLILSVAILIISFNLLGLIPYSFTVTSQLFVTFTLSVSLFVGLTCYGLWINKFNFFQMFVPNGVENNPLQIFLCLIEILSYIISPLSLGIRLFANMLAGHVLMYILASFMYYVVNINIIFIILLPIAVVVAVFLLEICIAIIQTYVFIILLIIYINDMFNCVH